MADSVERDDLDTVVSALEATLGRAQRLVGDLQRVTPAARNGSAEKIERLQRNLVRAENDLDEVSEQLVEAENQRSRLMNLYVATYQLHATLDLDEVLSTVGEISRELLGAEKYCLLLLDESDDCYKIALAAGIGESDRLFVGDIYSGGDPSVDRTLDDGVLRMEPEAGSEVLAVVPLRVQGADVGALAIIKLFDHKPNLTAEDRDLLDLMAAHAASALLAAKIYSTTGRKLKTLENLVKLVQ